MAIMDGCIKLITVTKTDGTLKTYEFVEDDKVFVCYAIDGERDKLTLERSDVSGKLRTNTSSTKLKSFYKESYPDAISGNIVQISIDALPTIRDEKTGKDILTNFTIDTANGAYLYYELGNTGRSTMRNNLVELVSIFGVTY